VRNSEALCFADDLPRERASHGCQMGVPAGGYDWLSFARMGDLQSGSGPDVCHLQLRICARYSQTPDVGGKSPQPVCYLVPILVGVLRGEGSSANFAVVVVLQAAIGLLMLMAAAALWPDPASRAPVWPWVVLMLVLIARFAWFQAFVQPSASMMPTLLIGDQYSWTGGVGRWDAPRSAAISLHFTTP